MFIRFNNKAYYREFYTYLIICFALSLLPKIKQFHLIDVSSRHEQSQERNEAEGAEKYPVH